MRVVALISGGKDSIFAMLECISQGHEIVALANMQPPDVEKEELEIDSFMFQSVAAEGVKIISKAMRKPLYQSTILGSANCQTLSYNVTDTDEVEDLFRLLASIKLKHPKIDGLVSGAILSNYQRERVENICDRLGWVSLAYLWRRDQKELLLDMISAGISARVVKIAAFGLTIKDDLGASLTKLAPHVFRLADDSGYGLNPCGEGGEFETFTFDSPIYHQRIVPTEDPKIVIHSTDPFTTVAYLRYGGFVLEDKDADDVKRSQTDLLTIENTVDIGGSFARRRPFISNEERLSTLSRDVPIELGNELFGIGQTDETVQSISLYTTGTCLGVSVSSSDTDIRERILGATRRALVNSHNVLASAHLGMDHVVFCQVSISDHRPFDSKILTEAFALVSGNVDAKNSRIRHAPPCYVCLASAWSADIVNLLEPEQQLPNDVPARDLIVVAISMTAVSNRDETVAVDYMRVRSLSHWAPASVGPYSQSVCVGPHGFYSGQIGLQPESLLLPPAGGGSNLDQQCWLALRHVHRLIMARESSGWRRLQYAIVYGTSLAVLQRAREQFHSSVCAPSVGSDTAGGITCASCGRIAWARVHGLPHGAAVCWQFATAPRPARIVVNSDNLEVSCATPSPGSVLLVRRDLSWRGRLPGHAVVVPVYEFLDASIESVFVDCK